MKLDDLLADVPKQELTWERVVEAKIAVQEKRAAAAKRTAEVCMCYVLYCSYAAVLNDMCCTLRNI